MNSLCNASLDKLFMVLKKHHYFSQNFLHNPFSEFLYGPLGCILKQNIFQEWCNSLLLKSSENIFSVSSSALNSNHHANSSSQLTTKSNSPNTMRENLSLSTLIHFKDILTLVDNQLPLGIVQSGICIGKPEAENDLLNVLNANTNNGKLNKEVERTNLLLQFFCSPSSSTKWFHYWQKKRHLWWRKYSGMQSSFSFTDIQMENGTQQVDIMHTSSWGNVIVETIKNSGSKLLTEYFGNEILAKYGRKIVTPHIIECSACLDTATVAYLWDSYQERMKKNDLKLVLRLHPSLAPYKVSIAISSSSKSNHQLRELAAHLTNELKRENHYVLPFIETKLALEQQFMKFDEMGIPYCIILNENSLSKGILDLRNRDTTLKEQVHMAELNKFLRLYLK